MNRYYLFPCFVSSLLVPVADISTSRASELASASPTAASSADWSDADGVSLPAGVSAESWAQTRTAIREAELPNVDMTPALLPRIDWKAEGNREDAKFGASVGSAGDVNGDGYDDVIVGSRYDDGAFVYYGSASGLSLTPDWTDALGASVGTAGDVNGDGYDDVIVGERDYGENRDGRALVYYGSALGLSVTPDWTAESNHSRDFGFSVGTAGDVNGDGYDDVVVGGLYPSGVYVYHGSASGLSLTPDWADEKNNQADTQFGYSVGTAGDVNGDGYDDVIVGAPLADNGQRNEGRAYVYYGSASGPSLTPDWRVESNQANAYLGTSVGTAGDVNRDGYDDVIVGADGYDNGEPGEGRAFVYYGSAPGLSATPDWTAESNRTFARLGVSVGTAGDVNDDGYDDVIVGADGNNGPQNGRAAVYFGSASGLSLAPDWTAHSRQLHDSFGWSVGTAGDVNGDSSDDVIVGAPYHDHGQPDRGLAVVFHGGRP